MDEKIVVPGGTNFAFIFFEATGGDCSPTDYKYIKQKEKSCAPKVLRNKEKKRKEMKQIWAINQNVLSILLTEASA